MGVFECQPVFLYTRNKYKQDKSKQERKDDEYESIIKTDM